MSSPEQLAFLLPLAHAAHWYVLLLFLAPAVLVVALAITSTLKARREARGAPPSERKESG
jgi:hypothetical protein